MVDYMWTTFLGKWGVQVVHCCINKVWVILGCWPILMNLFKKYAVNDMFEWAWMAWPFDDLSKHRHK